jgi:hypothetical protein
MAASKDGNNTSGKGIILPYNLLITKGKDK